MNDKEEKRCKTCNRIIVGDSKLGICSDCARKGKNGGAGLLGVLGTVLFFVVTKGRKK